MSSTTFTAREHDELHYIARKMHYEACIWTMMPDSIVIEMAKMLIIIKFSGLLFLFVWWTFDHITFIGYSIPLEPISEIVMGS